MNWIHCETVTVPYNNGTYLYELVHTKYTLHRTASVNYSNVLTPYDSIANYTNTAS